MQPRLILCLTGPSSRLNPREFIDGFDYVTLQSKPLQPPNHVARSITWTILGVNALLLIISLPDYRVSIDSGYHISLARWYAAHGTAWWDHINYGPGGRPNLQGPALHVAIAILGRMIGGSADSFILANAILALAQWSAAMLTVLYFARRLGGDIAAMFAVALLAGNAFAAASFYVGIPSGWLFISVPWAIYFFLEDRLVVASLIVSAACYVHLGGFLTAPFGILVAAILERRWRALIIVGAATAILTSPYSIHFLINLAWYRGRHGHEATHLDPVWSKYSSFGAWRVVSEFSRFQGPEADLAAEKASRSLGFLSKFPTQQIREFQNVIRELFCGIREFTGDNRDNHTIFVYSPFAL